MAVVAAAALVHPSTAKGGSQEEVYVAAVELRATRGPGQLVMSAAYSLNLWDLQHFMVLIKPTSSDPPPQVQFTAVTGLYSDLLLLVPDIPGFK